MSGNLCRCGAYNGIVEAIERRFADAAGDAMSPFAYARAARRGRCAARSIAAQPRREVPRRRHQPRRPDARDHRAAGPRSSTSRGLPRGDRGARATAGCRSARPPQHCARRASAPSASATRCSRARSSRAPRRRSATWRPSAATCFSARAAPISTTTPVALQQARARHGLRRDRRLQPHATRSSAPRRLRRHPSVGHVRGAGRARRRRAPRAAPNGERTRRRSTDFHRLPGDTPAHRDGARARRADHRGRAARPAAAARSTYRKVRDRASYAFALVSVAAALEVDDGTVKTCGSRSAASARSRGARMQAEQALHGRAPRRASFPRRGRGGARGRRPLERQRVQDRARASARSSPCSSDCGRRRMSTMQDAVAAG